MKVGKGLGNGRCYGIAPVKVGKGTRKSDVGAPVIYARGLEKVMTVPL